MKVTAVETLVSPIQPNVCVVVLHSDDGLTGLGETFYGASAVEAYIHHQAAPVLLALDHCAPETAALALATYVGYQGSGTETRGNSAIDLALWDLVARRAGLPLRDILGGSVHDSIPVYNTCAGTNYINKESRQSSENWGVPSGTDTPVGHYEDLWAFLHHPGRLAKELRAAGVRGMKVWPFDLAAEASRGDHRADLRAGLDILTEIRSEVGMDLELYVELHSLWTLRGAARLLRELREFSPAWVEDPLRPDAVEGLKRLAAGTDVPIATGESLAGRRGFKPLLDADAIDVAIVDLGWSGGLTEARKIASLAEHYQVPVAPHDCTGPISLAAGVHWVTSSPNGMVQEYSRAFYHGWYTQYVTELPPIVDGRIRPVDGPGLGMTLRAELREDPRTRIIRSTHERDR